MRTEMKIDLWQHLRHCRLGLWLLGLAALVAGCGGVVGAYRGPEPFGGKDYAVAPPRVKVPGTVKVVLLLLKDERPPVEHELDFVRQANPLGSTLGQPREVRKEFDRALKSGLAAHPGIQIVTPEAFAETRAADLLISGRILRCEGEKKMAWASADFHGRASMEIVLRDAQGKTLLLAPAVFSAEVVRPFTAPFSDAHPDEFAIGIAARGMEEAIRQVAEKFLSSRELAAALVPGGAPPTR